METKIQKWGNSVGIRIPKKILEKHSLREGSYVVINDNNNAITIKKSTTTKSSLKDLVSAISSKNIHRETDWDVPQGNEAW